MFENLLIKLFKCYEIKRLEKVLFKEYNSNIRFQIMNQIEACKMLGIYEYRIFHRHR